MSFARDQDAVGGLASACSHPTLCDRVHPRYARKDGCGHRPVQQARNLATELGTRKEFLRFLLGDRDGKYGQSFDAVFEAEEMEILLSAPRAPRMNGGGRVIGSIRREALGHVP